MEQSTSSPAVAILAVIGLGTSVYWVANLSWFWLAAIVLILFGVLHLRDRAWLREYRSAQDRALEEFAATRDEEAARRGR